MALSLAIAILSLPIDNKPPILLLLYLLLTQGLNTVPKYS